MCEISAVSDMHMFRFFFLIITAMKLINNEEHNYSDSRDLKDMLIGNPLPLTFPYIVSRTFRRPLPHFHQS